MWILVCFILSHKSLKLSLFFFIPFLCSDWKNPTCLHHVCWSFLLLQLVCNWTHLEFFSAVNVVFNSVISVWYFLIFSFSLLKFSLHSCIVLLTWGGISGHYIELFISEFLFSILLRYFPGVLSCFFIWNIFLCFFIFLTLSWVFVHL